MTAKLRPDGSLCKRWRERPSSGMPADLEDLADALGVSQRLARILWRRGLTDGPAMQAFLTPGLRNLAPLEDWPGLLDAAGILARELERGSPLAVWGDYDADGVTSTALMLDFLKQRGIEARGYLPHRREEGYGLNLEGIETLAAEGVRALLTVDCGVADAGAVARAKELGMTVVVSDHHLPKEELPPADAVVNPRLAECPCPDLAGVGVAFLLAAALNKQLPGQPMDIRRLLDLVALGTLADVVELTGQNRILTKNGMLLLSESRRPGVAALKEAAGYSMKAEMTAGQISFGLAPRINAAGRMDEANLALDLLLAPDLETARPLARRLDEMNAERRSEEEHILEEAMAQAREQLAGGERQGLALAAPHWHPGVVGIVASRVTEAFYRPAFVLTQDGEQLKGSGRSIREVDLHRALEECAEHLTRFGGHRQAAGVGLDPERLEDFRSAFDAAVRAQIGDEPLAPCLTVEEELPFSEIDFTLVKELELLQPFGQGNPEPVFASPTLEVRNIRNFGRNNAHATLDLRDPEANVCFRGKAFRQGEALAYGVPNSRLRLAFTPKIDTYNGLASIDVLIKDWRPA